MNAKRSSDVQNGLQTSTCQGLAILCLYMGGADAHCLVLRCHGSPTLQGSMAVLRQQYLQEV